MSDPVHQRERSRRLLLVLAALIVTASISGFFMGLQGNRSKLSLSRPVETPTADSRRRAEIAPSDVATAVRYDQVDRRRDGPNAIWGSSVRQLMGPPAAEAAASEADLAAANARRSQRRAFDGAPPVIPHPIQQDSSAACLACHAEGLQVKDRTASKISHPHFANCTQCHVPAAGPVPTQDSKLLVPLAGNVFLGSRPTSGTRAFVGAPPTMPHPVEMRTDCLSCHGPAGTHRLRTPHPDRQSCVQCHVSSTTAPPATTTARP